MAKLTVTPPDLNECKTYEAFKRELSAWAAVTDLAEKKQGNYIALSLPNKSEFGNDLRERVFENLTVEELNAEDGLKKLTSFLDKELGKNAVDDVIEKWDAFDSCKKDGSQSLEEFIIEFETKSKRVQATGTVLSGEILAYMLMKRAGLSNLERMLVLSRVEMTDKKNIYKNVKTHMSNILGKCMKNSDNGPNFKLEPAFLAQHEDVLAAHGYHRNRAYTAPSKYQKYPGNTKYKKGNTYSKMDNRMDKAGRPVNPKGSDGKFMTCKACGSFRHLVKDCQHSFEKTNNHAFHVEDETHEESCNVAEELENIDNEFAIERFVLFTTDKEELSKFTSESINAAALDTCCTSTVAGEKWLKIYLNSLPGNMKDAVQGPFQGKKCFQFGNQGVLKSTAKYLLPAQIGGHKIMIAVDIIPSDIPMLLSKSEMKLRGTTLYMLEDRAEILGTTMDLKTTSAGHYLLPLLETGDKDKDQENVAVESVCVVNLKQATIDEKKTALTKLHKQFGHRPKQSFINLLQSAESWTEDMSEILDKIIEGCEGCIKRRRNPDKPAVAMAMATEFNEKVAMDLKIWNGKYILYMIDMWSRLTVAVVIPRKKPSDVIEAIMQKWVAVYGVMTALLSDNGGEFTGEEMREVKSTLNVVELTTGADSPWQNGLCERNHALADNILDRIHEDNPHMDLNTKLAWACMAKNSLQMVYGYSPNQLVFGKNPKLPNVVTDGPPAWENKTASEVLAKHLNALHSARTAFIKSESCHKLKLALKSKVRTNEQTFENGDIVYYRRDMEDKWLGQGKVVFQDGKVIFVRQGAYFVRVSANRILKAGEELARKISPEELSDSCGQNTCPAQNDQSPLKDSSSMSSSKNSLYGKGQARDQDITFFDDTPKDMVQETMLKESLLTKSPSNGSEEESSLQSVEDQSSPKNSADQSSFKNSGMSTAYQSQTQTEKILLRKNDRIRFKENDGWVDAVITGRGKTTGKYKNGFNVRRMDGVDDHSVDLEAVDYEMVMQPENEQILMVTIPKEEQNTPACLEAKQTELNKLKEFGTYEAVSDLEQDRISCTWVLSSKGEEIRARLVARGYEETREIPKDSPTLAKSSLRIILSIATSKGWTVETTDIKSAFLQGSTLDRVLFVKPPKEATDDKGKLWKLVKCLYGLRDASRQWYFKVRTTLLALGFKQSDLDPGVFYRHENGNLIGLVGLHVDDFIHAGDEKFNSTILPKAMEIFQVGKNERGSFMYTGFKIDQDAQGITLDQSHFTKNIEIKPIEASRLKDKKAVLTEDERSDLRKMTGSLNWAVRATRPDLSFEMIELSTKFRKGTVEDLTRARKALGNLKQNKAEIRIPNLGNANHWEMLLYSDAALGNLNDGIDSTGGHIILLTNANRKMCVAIDWQANKTRRVARSSLTAEALSLCDGLDNAIYLRDLIEEILNVSPHTIKIHARVDNQSTVDALNSTTAVHEKRLRREIGSMKQMCERGIVKSIDWVPGSEQLADVLTKRGVNGCELLQIIQSGRFTSSPA